MKFWKKQNKIHCLLNTKRNVHNKMKLEGNKEVTFTRKKKKKIQL